MTEAAFRRIALGFDGAVEASHMGHPDFRTGAGGRIFATLHGNRTTGMVMLTPEQQGDAIAAHPETFEPEAGAWGRQGSTRVRLRHATDDVIGEAMTLAWQNAIAKAKKPRAARKVR